MLTKLAIQNFKQFDRSDIELGERVLFVGPNNSGKTSALQALALWSVGVRKWAERHGDDKAPRSRPGATINRRDLIAVPVPTANLLWRNLKVREGMRENGKQRTSNVLIEIAVQGVDAGQQWALALEFDYANPESLYCRVAVDESGERPPAPKAARELKVAYLPPMSGLAANELRLDQGAIDVRIGEGRTAEVLRNLCWSVLESDRPKWAEIVDNVRRLFGVELKDPQYVRERGEIVMSFTTRDGVELDLAASGRGQQQTILLLAHMAANPGSLLLLDEPDAHLEILRQRQIYETLTQTARATDSQIIAASHSEVLLNEAADRDTVVAFLGRPHRIDDRGAQLMKSLKEIGFENYVAAQETGWVLYLEGSTDLSILRSFASRLDHKAKTVLERPFVHYVGNQPGQARAHFFALREAVPNLRGLAIYDRLDRLEVNPRLEQVMWTRREIENYLSSPATLAAWAEDAGRRQHGDLFGSRWRELMTEAIEKIGDALTTLGRDARSPDLKVSEEFLPQVFDSFYRSVELPNLMRKTDFHTLAPFVPEAEIDAEVRGMLDRIVKLADGDTASNQQ